MGVTVYKIEQIPVIRFDEISNLPQNTTYLSLNRCDFKEFSPKRLPIRPALQLASALSQ